MQAQTQGFLTPEQQQAQLQGFMTPEQQQEALKDFRTPEQMEQAETKAAFQKAGKMLGSVQSNVSKAEADMKAVQSQNAGAIAAPTPVTMQALPQGPSIAGENLIAPHTFGGSDVYGDIFGRTPPVPSPQAWGMPVLKTPALVKPPPMPQVQPAMSDRNAKENVRSARRSIKEFLAQVRIVNG